MKTLDMGIFDAKLKPKFEECTKAANAIIFMIEEFIHSHGPHISRPDSWAMFRDATSWIDLSESVEKYINNRMLILRIRPAWSKI
jgi:hypothetical protein